MCSGRAADANVVGFCDTNLQPIVDMTEARVEQRGANEYPRELYPETSQVKTVQEPETLDNICSFDCGEYRILAMAIDSRRDWSSASSA